jgi:hypothetical protein
MVALLAEQPVAAGPVEARLHLLEMENQDTTLCKRAASVAAISAIINATAINAIISVTVINKVSVTCAED